MPDPTSQQVVGDDQDALDPRKLKGPPTPEWLERKKRQLAQCRWRLKPSVLLRVEEEGSLLFDPDADSLVPLNQTGTALLRWKPTGIVYDEWCRALCEHYPDIDASRIADDVLKFMLLTCFFLELDHAEHT
jgi:hypothetical protein